MLSTLIPARFCAYPEGWVRCSLKRLRGTLTITLKPVDGGTRIQWFYVVGGYARFKFPEMAVAVDKVLVQQVTRLGDKLGVPAKEIPLPADAKP